MYELTLLVIFLNQYLQVQDATLSVQLQYLLMDEIDLLAESGCNMPITHVNINNRAVIVDTVVLHHYLLKPKAEVDQFGQELVHKSGLLHGEATHRKGGGLSELALHHQGKIVSTCVFHNNVFLATTLSSCHTVIIIYDFYYMQPRVHKR